jgi:ankyrin repeat protein
MKCLLPLLMSLIVSSLVLVSQPGRTDITPIDYHASPTGGGVSPKSPHQTIRMDDQEVLIRLKPFSYTVDAIFHLTNTDETTTELIGFPKNAMGRAPGPLGGVSDFIRFHGSVNDQNIAFKEERDLIADAQNVLKGLRSGPLEHCSWLAGEATFPGHAISTIRVSYEADYDNCGMGCQKAIYIYGTGRYWKDSIGNASFIIDSTERGGVERANTGFSTPETQKHVISRRLISANVVRYEIRDLEPEPGGALSITLSTGRPTNDGNKSALVHAALNGRLEQVQALLEKGADVNANAHGETPLMSAAWGGHLKVAKLLVEKGADVNAETESGTTALKKALSNAWMCRGQLEVAKFLKDQGAKPTTLAVAAFVGDMETAQRLMTEGADINQTNKPDDQNILMAAAMGGQTDMVKLLLDKGLDVAAKDKRGQTALIVASAAGNAKVVELLLDRGADVNAKDSHRRSALSHAVFLRGHVEAVKVLLDRGADINARDDPADRTVLMHAAQDGLLEVVKLLLDKGADVNARDCGGKTALSLAKGKDVEEIELVLKAHGGKK